MYTYIYIFIYIDFIFINLNFKGGHSYFLELFNFSISSEFIPFLHI